MYRGFVRDAAERLFASRGVVHARMIDIARESKVSIGTIYRLFPGRKGEIYRSIHESRGTALLGHTRGIGLEVWRQRGDLLDAVFAGTVAMVEFFAAHPNYLRLVLREEKTWVSPTRASREQTAMWHMGNEGIARMMQHGAAERVLVDDDPECMARAWVAIQEAHLGHWLERGMKASAAEVAGRLQRQFLRAFCRPEVVAARERRRPGRPTQSAEGERR
jgi:AcrR family transcriptional regulator